MKFLRTTYPLNSIVDYQVEIPGGAATKEWLTSKDTTPDQMRSECRVDYDGNNLRVVGPGSLVSFPGIKLAASPN